MSDFAHSMAAHRNSSMERRDIRWVVTHSGEMLLTDCPNWQAAHTKQLEANAERDRKQFNHRAKYPATATGEAA